MDFPLVLQPSAGSASLEFVYGMEELRNDLYLLLKEVKGSFLQSPDIGTTAVPHQDNELYLESAVRRVCEQISDCKAEFVAMQGDWIVIRVVYKGQTAQFNFSVMSFS